MAVSDNRPPVPPLERCPARLADLMCRCWARAHLERPSAEEAAEELRHIMALEAAGGSV